MTSLLWLLIPFAFTFVIGGACGAWLLWWWLDGSKNDSVADFQEWQRAIAPRKPAS